MAVNTWTGATDTNYNTAANWDLGHKPSAGESVAFSGSVNCAMNEATAILEAWDMTGYTGILSSTGNIRIDNAADAVCKFAGGTHTWSGQLLLNPATTRTLSLTSAGKLGSCTGLTQNGAGTVSLQDALTLTAGRITITTGVFLTNNYNISCVDFYSTGTGTRTLTFGSSIITCTKASNYGWRTDTTTNLTVTDGTYEIILSGSAATITTGNKLYNKISFTGSGSHTFYSQITVNTLNLTADASQTCTYNILNITINTALNINGNSAINRLLVQSNAIGTARTITLGASATMASVSNYVDLQDITMSGGAANERDFQTNAKSAGDCGGNTGITFTTAADQTWSGATGYWKDYTLWTSRIPLPQDNVIIPDPGAASRTLTADMPRLGKDITVTNTTAANKPTLALTNQNVSVYGSLTLVSSTYMTFSCNKTLTFASRSNCSWTTAGNSFTNIVYSDCYGATLTVNDAISSGTNIQVRYGGFICHYTMTISNFWTSAGTTIDISDANIYLSGGWTAGFWDMKSTNLTATNSTITESYTGATAHTFYGGTQTYNDIIITPGSGVLTFSGAFTFHDMKRSGAGTKTINFTKNTNYTMTGDDFFKPISGTDKFTLTGTGNGTTDAERWTLTNNTTRVDTDYLDITECKAAGSTAPFYAGANSTADNSTNTGWTFTAPPATGSAAWLTQLNQAVMGSPFAGAIR